MATALLAALGIALLALAIPPRATLSAPTPTQRNIVLVLTGDLMWEDIAAHPDSAIAALAPHAQTANLLPQATASTCPYDAWFLLSAGRPSDTLGAQDSGCFDIPLAPSTEFPYAPSYREAMAAWHDRATPGLFAQALEEAGIEASAIGTGAAVTLADADFRTPALYHAAPVDNAELAELVAESARTHRLTVVDADRRTRPIGNAPEEENTEANLARLDAIAEAAPAGTRILVAAANPGPHPETYPLPALLLAADLPADATSSENGNEGKESTAAATGHSGPTAPPCYLPSSVPRTYASPATPS